MLFDLQGAQSVDHRDRGVARYVVELAMAIERRDPSLVDAYLLNPDLALPGGTEPLVASGKLRFVDEDHVYGAGALVPRPSPFDLSIPIERLVPPAARAAGVRWCATVFDLVQLAMPETYLEDPGLRRRYLARLELVRSADLVLAISDHVAREVNERLGVPRDRIASIPLAPSSSFRPPASKSAALQAAMDAVPGLRSRFVLYTGGSDGRKNLEGLTEAWALLPADVRAMWQLVVAGSLPPLRRNHLEVLARSSGIADGGFLCTGFVAEDMLVALNQTAELFVFPSLAEGYGLPIAEAMACGTPCIGGDNTSIVELLPPEARFDASSPDAIAAAITRALTDERHRPHLVEVARSRPPRTWDDVAAETIASFRARLGAVPAPKRAKNGRARLRIAFATPLPPQPGGVAEYSRRLLGELAERCDVDAFVDGPPHERQAMLSAEAPPGVTARPLAALERVEGLCGRYDAVVYSLGNSEFHTGALAALSRRPGVVLAHEVRLTNLYRFAAWQHPDAAPDGFAATLHRMYEGRVPADLGERGWLTDDEAERWGLLMARDAIAASTQFLTTSAFAANLARLDAAAADRHKVGVVPFAVSDGTDTPGAPARERPHSGAPVVASFGVVNERKQSPLLVRAFAKATVDVPDVRLVFVGPTSAGDAAAIARAAEAAGMADRVEVTGEVDRLAYAQWLRDARIAVQLRDRTNGESSAAIGDCLAAGLPTLVTDIGANRELPDDAVVRVASSVDDTALGTTLRLVLLSEDRRRDLSTAARAYAESRSFAATADALFLVVASLA